MLINILKYIKGYIKIRITGDAPERFMNLCSNKNILIWRINPVENGYELYISRKSVCEIKGLLKKTHTKIKILDKIGLPFFMYRYRKRKLFAIGLIICMALVYTLSLFVWDIKIVGTDNYTNDQILKYIEENYVNLGDFKYNINCDKLEKILRKKYDEIAWINCELSGTQLIVTIKETLDLDTVEKSDDPCDIIAYKDGVITSIITRNGTPVVKKDIEVKKGDILISGTIYIYDDNKEVLETNYIPADGDVYAQTIYDYDDSFEMSFYEKKYTSNKKTYFSIAFMDKFFTPYKPKNKYKNSDLIEESTKLKIGKTFYLPVTIEKSQIKEYEPARKTYTEDEAYNLAKKRLDKYINDLTKKGVEIVENNVKIQIVDGICYANGQIIVKELIGVPSTINN